MSFLVSVPKPWLESGSQWVCVSVQLQCRWLAGDQMLVLGQQDIKVASWTLSRSPERPGPWSVSAEAVQPQCAVLFTFMTTSGLFQRGDEWRTGEERARGQMTHQRFPSRMWQRIQVFWAHPNLAKVAELLCHGSAQPWLQQGSPFPLCSAQHQPRHWEPFCLDLVLQRSKHPPQQ